MRAVGVSSEVLEPELPASSGLLITLFTLCYRRFSIVWGLVVLGFLWGVVAVACMLSFPVCFPSFRLLHS